MKGRLLSFIALCVLSVFFSGGVLFADTIPLFDVHITVLENATIEVTERIEYDFSERERHGIFRKIPYSYQAGTKTYTADILSVLVTDGEGAPRPFVESRGNGELELKIGDPNATVTGKHTYVISYIVKGPFLYFEEQDELYWNVTGYWEESIGSASVLLDLPRGATVLDASCYRGVGGATAPCDEGKKLVGAEQAGYRATANSLAPREGLTVAVAFPKGVIAPAEDVPWKDIVTWIDLLPLALPLCTLLFMLYLWHTRGRDPKGKSAIVTEFAPPLGLSASLAGVVQDERVAPRDIVSEIIALATEGYLRIHKVDTKILLFTVTEYLFERTGTVFPEDPVQALVLEKVFQKKYEGTVEVSGTEVQGALLSKMKNNFSREKKEIADFIYEEVYMQGFFMGRPDSVRTVYMVGGVLCVFVGGVLAVALGDSVLGVLAGVSGALSGFLVALFSNWMPARTREGVRVREHLLGFKRYLGTAEKDRIAFHDAPEGKGRGQEKTMELFSTYLPYAMVFGVEDEWARQFDGMFDEAPSWYSTATHGAFTTSLLADGLKDFSSDFSTAMAPSSSGAGGGGSVGGGFGGGGGGSW